METMDFLKGALLVCKKMFGDEFENLSNEEKQAVVMKVLNDTLNQNPILMQAMGAAMQKEFCAAKTAKSKIKSGTAHRQCRSLQRP